MSIPIHPERGLDPHLTFCPNCGDETSAIVIGHLKVIEHPDGRKAYANRGRVNKLLRELGWDSVSCKVHDAEEHERIPGDLCEKCKKNIADMHALVRNGGVYFRCLSCGTEGALKPDVPLAKATREHALKTGVIKDSNESIGVEVETCPQCEKEVEPSDNSCGVEGD